MWVVARNEGWEDDRLCENVVNEIFDMAQAQHPSRLSKSDPDPSHPQGHHLSHHCRNDLTKCGKANQIIGMMADMMEFWKYENGEEDDPASPPE